MLKEEAVVSVGVVVVQIHLTAKNKTHSRTHQVRKAGFIVISNQLFGV